MATNKSRSVPSKAASKPTPSSTPPKPTPSSTPPKPTPSSTAPSAPAAEVAKKKVAPRKPPIERAEKLAKLFDRHGTLLHRLVGNWQGEATPDQATTNSEIVVDLEQATKLAQRIMLDIDALKASGFRPVAGSGAEVPLSAGAKVVIKEKFFNVAMFGPDNRFEVVVSVGSTVRIKSTTDQRAPQIAVLRSWLEEIDTPDVDLVEDADLDSEADEEDAPDQG